MHTCVDANLPTARRNEDRASMIHAGARAGLVLASVLLLVRSYGFVNNKMYQASFIVVHSFTLQTVALCTTEKQNPAMCCEVYG